MLAAARSALDTDKIGYTNALGIPPLRAAIARHYRDTAGIDVDPRNVAVTTGSSGAFLYAFLAAFDAGDTVAMARPGYPAYRNMLAALGCRVLELPCGAATRFQPTVAQLDALDEPPAGLVARQPGQPDRDDGRAGRARRARRLVRRARHPAGQRRDLSRHHLRPARRVAPGRPAATR